MSALLNMCVGKGILWHRSSNKKKIGNFCLDVAFSAGEEMFARLVLPDVAKV